MQFGGIARGTNDNVKSLLANTFRTVSDLTEIMKKSATSINADGIGTKAPPPHTAAL